MPHLNFHVLRGTMTTQSQNNGLVLQSIRKDRIISMRINFFFQEAFDVIEATMPPSKWCLRRAYTGVIPTLLWLLDQWIPRFHTPTNRPEKVDPDFRWSAASSPCQEELAGEQRRLSMQDGFQPGRVQPRHQI